jgi:LmbE family N-acetylglucosaminyl deacetylase
MAQKILVLGAHPDDAELFAGGTLAKMAREGAEITVVVATTGDKGSFELDQTELSEIRRAEARQAADILGVKKLSFLNHQDGALDQLQPGYLREQFVRAIRERKPDALFTFDPFAPFEDHPDHRTVAFAALEAANYAPYPLYYPEHLDEGLDTHMVDEKYFFAKVSTHANKAVDITQTLQTKVAALLAHKSQVAFLFKGWEQQATLAGIDISNLAVTDAGGPALVMALAIQEQARIDGATAGMAFAERFRYARFPPAIEVLMKMQDEL